MKENGDSQLILRGEDAIVATIDFNNKYIKREKRGKYQIQKNSILLFSWTDYEFRNVEVDKIKSIKSLNSILGNVANEERNTGWRFV